MASTPGSIAFWSVTAGSSFKEVLELRGRRWLGVAAWSAALASVMARLLPIDQPQAESLTRLFAVTFLLLNRVRTQT